MLEKVYLRGKENVKDVEERGLFYPMGIVYVVTKFYLEMKNERRRVS